MVFFEHDDVVSLFTEIGACTQSAGAGTDDDDVIAFLGDNTFGYIANVGIVIVKFVTGATVIRRLVVESSVGIRVAGAAVVVYTACLVIGCACNRGAITTVTRCTLGISVMRRIVSKSCNGVGVSAVAADTIGFRFGIILLEYTVVVSC